jgi:DNA-binding winged helix-turn-helix (wHTH) protein
LVLVDPEIGAHRRLSGAETKGTCAMQTNRKHALAPDGASSAHTILASSEEEEPWSWSKPPLAPRASEATRATEMLADDFNPGSMLPLAPATVQCGALEIDRIEHRAAVAGRALSLTRREYAVLLCLADHANRVVPRSVLLDTIWTSTDDRGSDVLEVYPWSNVVNVYVNHLRRKLGAHAAMLETIRGYGYCLRPRSGHTAEGD